MLLNAMRAVLITALGSALSSFLLPRLMSWLKSKAKSAQLGKESKLSVEQGDWSRRVIKRETAGKIEEEINKNTLSKRRPYVKSIRTEIEKVIRGYFNRESIRVDLQGSVRKGTGIGSSDLDLLVTGVSASNFDRQAVMIQCVAASQQIYSGSLGRRRILLRPVDGHHDLPSIDLIFQDLNGKQTKVRQPDAISRLNKRQANVARVVARFLKWMPHAPPSPSSLLGGYEELRKPNHHIEGFVRLVVLELQQLDLSKNEPRTKAALVGSDGVALLLKACLLKLSRDEQVDEDQQETLKAAGVMRGQWALAAGHCITRLSSLHVQ